MSWYNLTDTELTFFLRVTPNAHSDTITGPLTRADGRVLLGVRVRAVPDKGKANAAVIALLAKALGQPRSAFTLISGATSREKTIAATLTDGADLRAAIAKVDSQ